MDDKAQFPNSGAQLEDDINILYGGEEDLEDDDGEDLKDAEEEDE